ncbi:MAG: hypothetical protein KF718_32410 [Polyangiaceae bacterium]|nr:hypothetical protein [Polyangiaceae bacterium]
MAELLINVDVMVRTTPTCGQHTHPGQPPSLGGCSRFRAGHSLIGAYAPKSAIVTPPRSG